jgi:hypothetical protein
VISKQRTSLLEGAARQLLDNARKILGEDVFEGDAHALLTLIYKNTSLPLELQMDATNAAIRFEKPAPAAIDASTTIENVHYGVSAEPITEDEWEQRCCVAPN